MEGREPRNKREEIGRKLSFFKKRKKSLFVLAVLLIVAAFFYLWIKIRSLPFERPGNYVIKEIPEGKLLENERIGLSFVVKQGWEIQESNYITGVRGGNEMGFVITNPGFESNPNSSFILLHSSTLSRTSSTPTARPTSVVNTV